MRWCAWTLLLAACGAANDGTGQPVGVEEAGDSLPLANEWDLTIEVQFMVDESLSTRLELDPRRLRDFRYEHRGDVGDGTEEVVACTGTLPDAEHEALAAALDLRSWADDREPFTVTIPGEGSVAGVWRAERQWLEGHTPIPHVPPSEDAMRAMVPTFERVLQAIRDAEGTWATCTTRME